MGVVSVSRQSRFQRRAIDVTPEQKVQIKKVFCGGSGARIDSSLSISIQ
jgi:hypothetical protein